MTRPSKKYAPSLSKAQPAEAEASKSDTGKRLASKKSGGKPAPRKLFLERKSLPLPDGFSIEQHLASHTWKHKPETLLVGAEGVLFYSEVGVLGPYLPEGSFRPRAHVRDGLGNEIFVWQDSPGGEGFFLSATPSGGESSQRAHFPGDREESGRDALFIDAIPEGEGVAIFWAERKGNNTDWEMMAAFWSPLNDPDVANDFAASLSNARESRQSLALLGQKIEEARVEVTRYDYGRYSAAWIAHEGKRAFVKSLRFELECSRWRGMKQRHLSGRGFVREALGGFEKLIPISGGLGVLLVGKDSIKVLSGSALEPRSEAEVIIEAEPNSIQTEGVPGGVIVAWFDERMRLALVSVALVSVDRQGAKVKTYRSNSLAEVEVLSENQHFSKHGVSPEAEIVLLGMTAVWLDGAGEKSLWALDWGGGAPECLVSGLPEETRLLAGAEGYFYLLGERSCFVCSVKNRGISGNLSSTIGQDVL